MRLAQAWEMVRGRPMLLLYLLLMAPIEVLLC
jgi:hypothetical protein